LTAGSAGKINYIMRNLNYYYLLSVKWHLKFTFTIIADTLFNFGEVYWR